MPELPVAPVDRADEGSNLRRFMAHRGALIMQESREISQVRGQYGELLSVTAVLFSIMKGASRKTSYGVRIERSNRDGSSEASAFLDFDELQELVDAFDFISALAPKMLLEQRDYTEVTYSTKDNVKFGFFQKDQQQQAFVVVASRGGNVFVSVETLASVRQAILSARTHLMSRGATLEQ
jgi:hypothetical protein